MTINQLYCIIADNLDDKLHTVGVGIFLDPGMASDTINHDILLDKLHKYGIRGLANDWIKSYLSGRQQCVAYNNIQSNPAAISCGVPQGSILGPLLFLLHMNDRPLCFKTPRFILPYSLMTLIFHSPILTQKYLNHYLILNLNIF